MAEREASNQKMVDQFRRDVGVWKDQAHAMKVAQEMAVKERNRFGRTAATLEREALKLGVEGFAKVVEKDSQDRKIRLPSRPPRITTSAAAPSAAAAAAAPAGLSAR